MNLLKEILQQMDAADRELACRVIDSIWAEDEAAARRYVRAMTDRRKALFDLALRWNHFESHEEDANGSDQN